MSFLKIKFKFHCALDEKKIMPLRDQIFYSALHTCAWYSGFPSNINTTVFCSTFLRSYHCFLQSINHHTLRCLSINNNNNNHGHNNNNKALTSVRCENMGTTAAEGPTKNWLQQRATHSKMVHWFNLDWTFSLVLFRLDVFHWFNLDWTFFIGSI